MNSQTPIGRKQGNKFTLVVVIFGVFIVSACTHLPTLSKTEKWQNSIGQFTFSFAEHEQQPSVQMVVKAVSASLPELLWWGKFSSPVCIKIYPMHRGLEQAVGFRGQWIRAWAQREVVFIQSPLSWNSEGVPSQKKINELMLHELTHCLMYQLASNGEEWQTKKIPGWFREGMASVTADQGYRRGTLRELKLFFLKNGGGVLSNVVFTENELESNMAYSIAHYSFLFLLQNFGRPAIIKLLSSMRRGTQFNGAFLETFGITHESFAERFRDYVLHGHWQLNRNRHLNSS